MSNYPDDIRIFDNHPNSPFFEAPLEECVWCDKFIEEDELHIEVVSNNPNQNFSCEDCFKEETDEY